MFSISKHNLKVVYSINLYSVKEPQFFVSKEIWESIFGMHKAQGHIFNISLPAILTSSLKTIINSNLSLEQILCIWDSFIQKAYENTFFPNDLGQVNGS